MAIAYCWPMVSPPLPFFESTGENYRFFVYSLITLINISVLKINHSQYWLSLSFKRHISKYIKTGCVLLLCSLSINFLFAQFWVSLFQKDSVEFMEVHKFKSSQWQLQSNSIEWCVSSVYFHHILSNRSVHQQMLKLAATHRALVSLMGNAAGITQSPPCMT